MTEFHINQRVRFTDGAQVSEAASAIGRGTVLGYAVDVVGEPSPEGSETAENDYVVVRVPARAGRKAFEQWVLPNEIEPDKGMVSHEHAGHSVH